MEIDTTSFLLGFIIFYVIGLIVMHLWTKHQQRKRGKK